MRSANRHLKSGIKDETIVEVNQVREEQAKLHEAANVSEPRSTAAALVDTARPIGASAALEAFREVVAHDFEATTAALRELTKPVALNVAEEWRKTTQRNLDILSETMKPIGASAALEAFREVVAHDFEATIATLRELTKPVALNVAEEWRETMQHNLDALSEAMKPYERLTSFESTIPALASTWEEEQLDFAQGMGTSDVTEQHASPEIANENPANQRERKARHALLHMLQASIRTSGGGLEIRANPT